MCLGEGRRVCVCVLTFGRGGGPLVVDLSAWVVERFEIT